MISIEVECLCCEMNQDIKGKDLDPFPINVDTVEKCQKACQIRQECLSFAFNQNDKSKEKKFDGCWLKSMTLNDTEAQNLKEGTANVTIGPKFCPGIHGVFPTLDLL